MGVTMRNLTIILLSLFAISSAMATLFLPLSVKKHLTESSAVVEGEVISFESELDENNKIVTRVRLKANKWLGDLEFNEDEVSLFYPGGQVGKQVRKIDGTPEFSIGESVVLFIKNDNGVSWISNLGLGKYSIKRVGDEKIIVNQIFPTEPNMGQMTLKNFYRVAQDVKSEKFSFRFKEKYELYNEQKIAQKSEQKHNSRSIASVDEGDDTETRLNPFWLVLLLGSLGLTVGIIRNRTS